ncbi:MAG: M48 family metallopeptidase [Pseudanabaena sp. ELA607]|jgi:predicted Zn-dependent protease
MMKRLGKLGEYLAGVKLPESWVQGWDQDFKPMAVTLSKRLWKLPTYWLRRWFLRYQKIALAGLLTMLLAIHGQPAQALDLGDLFRVLPAAMEIIQISNLSDEDEVKLGRQIDQQLRSKVKISSDPLANQLINGLGKALALNSDRPNIPYTFQVVDDKNLNAFATMGGFVYINSGTIANADNIAQLAAVMSHEIGHIAGKHALENIKNAAIQKGIASVIGVEDNQLIQLGAQLALQLPNSREAENDADRRGLGNLVRSGFAAAAMPAFMQKLAAQSAGGTSVFSTHPAPADRVVTLNSIINERGYRGGKGLDDQAYQALWRNRFNAPQPALTNPTPQPRRRSRIFG